MSGDICKTPVYADRGQGVSDQDVSELALYAGHILLESGAELSNSGRGALSDAVAIVLGIVIVSELPQSFFSFIGKKHFFK